MSQSSLQDLMQLHALLCRSEGADVAAHLERKVAESGLKMESGALSLQLLTFPHTGKMKQVSYRSNELKLNRSSLVL